MWLQSNYVRSSCRDSRLIVGTSRTSDLSAAAQSDASLYLKVATRFEMSSDRKPSSMFALLFCPQFRSVNSFIKHSNNMTITDVPVHTVCDFFGLSYTSQRTLSVSIMKTSSGEMLLTIWRPRVRPRQRGALGDVSGARTYNQLYSLAGSWAVRATHAGTAPLTYRCWFILFIKQIYVLNILNMLHTLRFFLFKMPFIS
jgi:hypothetical protein